MPHQHEHDHCKSNPGQHREQRLQGEQLRQDRHRHGHQLGKCHIELEQTHHSAAHFIRRQVLDQDRAGYHSDGHPGAETDVANNRIPH